MMRPPKRLEAPACRTGCPPQNDAAAVNGAAAEAPGGAGVPNRVFASNDAAAVNDAAAEAPGGAGVPNRVFASELRGRRQ